MAFHALLIEGLHHGLKYVENDISRMNDTFQKINIATDIIKLNNGSHVRNRLEDICAGAHPNDSVFIYYTGHGESKAGKLQFQFSNSGNIYQDYLSVSTIIETLGRSDYSKIILLLDCCHAAAAERAMMQEDSERFHLIYSSGPLEKSWELDDCQASAFTMSFCDAIDDTLCNVQEDFEITLAHLDSLTREKANQYRKTYGTHIPLPGAWGSKADQIILYTSYANTDAALTAKISDYYLDFLSCIETCKRTCTKGYAWCNALSTRDIEVNKYVIPTVNTSDGSQMKLNDFFTSWVNSGDNHLALLGNVGVGKTSACFYLVSLVAKQQIGYMLVPVFVPLHAWDELSRKCDVLNSSIYFSNNFFTEAEIQQLIKSRQLLFLFDGFDEISAESTLSSILANFKKLAPFLRLGCKTLLTCRTHYFAEESQISDVLQGKASGTDFASLLQNNSQYSFEIAELQEFSESEILEVIQLSVSPDEANSIWEDIKSLYDLRDLAKRAIILKMILKTLPQLKRKSQSRRITTSTLYDLYTHELIVRELQNRSYRMDVRDIESFIEYIASLMWRNQTLSINTDKFREEIADFYHQQEGRAVYNLDQYIYSGRVSSFFVRDKNNNYAFSHKSFFEYYFSRYCVKSIETNINDPCWSKKWFDKEIAAFITDIIQKSAKKHPIFYLFDAANSTTDPIVIWNTLHILSLLDIDDVRPFLTDDTINKLLQKADSETNCVIIRQYCRIIAKFIDRAIAEQYIDKIIQIVQTDPAQNQENNETYYNYYGGKEAACQAFIKHLHVPKPKYDAKLHIYLLGDIASVNYLSQFESVVSNWSPEDYEKMRPPIIEATQLISARSEFTTALPHQL